MIKLDIGCGRNPLPSYIGIDKSPSSGAHYIIDIEKEPLPFKDEEVDAIHMSHTIEHLENVIFVINECWRILKWGGQVDIRVPHFDCRMAVQDPTHKKFFVQDSFKFYCGSYLVKYSLSYGIKAIFREIANRKYYPNGEDKKEYCTMIQVVLEKDLYHHNKYVCEYPFSTYKMEEKEGFIAEGSEPLSPEGVHNMKFGAHLNQMLEIKKDATKRYGTDPAPLGGKGLFADMNRKMTRLKRFLWNGETATSESVKDTCYDLAVYAILTVMELEDWEEHDD